MFFLHEAGAAFLLTGLTLALQCAGMAALIHFGKSHVLPGAPREGPVRSGLLMVRFTGQIICLHMLQILLWAAFFRWTCFPSSEASFYYSAAEYATVGSDLIPPHVWRNLGPVESVTGVLMCGLSASFLFAVVTRMLEREGQLENTRKIEVPEVVLADNSRERA